MLDRSHVVTAVAAVAATVGVLHCYKLIKEAEKPEVQLPSRLVERQYLEELIEEQLARNYAFLGDDGMRAVRDQRIVVVGVGGVGSWVATMLVRAGVGHIKLIDFDQVTLSSLNRHAVATTKDVGISKVNCLKNHLSQVAPWVNIEVENSLWTLDQGEELIYGKDGQWNPTFVIDCIDNIDTKVDLLEYCFNKGLKVISLGGAACKNDPTRLNVADISKTEEDALLRQVRVRLKKRGILKGIPVVFSAEKPDPRKAQLLPITEEELAKGDVDQLTALRNFRVRILPVLGTMPGMFGLTIATYVLCQVAGYPMEPVEGKNRYHNYELFLTGLGAQLIRLGVKDNRVPIKLSEVPYILEEVWRGKSPISGYLTRLVLSQWDPKKPLLVQNMVVMTKEEMKVHEQRILLGSDTFADVYSPEVLALVAKRFADEQYFSQFR
ncbi:tRNA threonylcarbamoyladenosine dehydratase [Kocuria palustris]|nr:tRNA threonylcarbamoyladenosine dehydratase [Kocuria palustris]